LEQKAAAPVFSAYSVPSKKGTHKGCPYKQIILSPWGGLGRGLLIGFVLRLSAYSVPQKIYCVIGRANPAPTEISPYFAQKLTQPGSLLFTASEKSINKTYICKNKTNILINKTIICINITFIYSF
ncbi:MAG: hypothetical protein J6R36_07110, partial [Bacteroidaceae bacterium]|nr:hypothetical protein [Bacteroidaceae bacterium]